MNYSTVLRALGEDVLMEYITLVQNACVLNKFE